jgi:UPF0716 protein FxsA
MVAVLGRVPETRPCTLGGMTTGAPHQPSPSRSRRSRGRSLAPLAVAAWLVLEIWLLALVGDAFGVLTVFLLLVAGVVAGAYVIKRAGRRAWRDLMERSREAQVGGDRADRPAGGGKTNENTLSLVGGVLLMVPGLISDVAGLLCLFPPTRAPLSRRLERSLNRRMGRARAGTLGGVFQQARMRRPDGKVIRGKVIRDDRPGDAERHDEGRRPPLEG